MIFGFYRKNDDNREVIRSQEFTDLNQALDFFSAMKGLTPEAFLELFVIIPLKRRQDGRF
jgi:hypothetical protein